MAYLALTDARVSINAVNMSAYIQEVGVSFEAADLETQTFGDTWTEVIPGLKSGTLTLKFVQDFAVGTVDSVIWALFGTVTAVAVRATTDAISTSNPEYQFNVLVKEWAPLNGAVGDLGTVDVTWPLSGSVTRDVTP